MSGEEDGCAAVDHALQHGLEHSGGDGVDALERLIEKQYPGPVNYGCGQCEFFLHAVREVRNQLASLVGKLHELQKLLRALIGGLAVQSIHSADKAEILGRGEAAEECHAFGHYADLALEVERRSAEWLAENLNGARARLEQTGKHLDSGGFARPVRPQKSEELPRSYAERHIVHGSEFAGR